MMLHVIDVLSYCAAEGGGGLNCWTAYLLMQSTFPVILMAGGIIQPTINSSRAPACVYYACPLLLSAKSDSDVPQRTNHLWLNAALNF